MELFDTVAAFINCLMHEKATIGGVLYVQTSSSEILFRCVANDGGGFEICYRPRANNGTFLASVISWMSSSSKGKCECPPSTFRLLTVGNGVLAKDMWKVQSFGSIARRFMRRFDKILVGLEMDEAAEDISEVFPYTTILL
jgi:hypothetical protein